MIRQIKGDDTSLPFIIEEWERTFPQHERRDTDRQCRLLQSSIDIWVLQVESEIACVAFVWQLPDCWYIEHLFTFSAHRNRQLGERMLTTLSRKTTTPIVLEAELPTDEMSRRRLQFYARNGFSVLPIAYEQPPYRAGDNWFPMHLLSNDEEQIMARQEEIIRSIYTLVYQVY